MTIDLIDPTRDFYAVLGVATTADAADIKTAWKRLAVKHHPDHGGDVRVMQSINEAHDILGNPEKRSTYDRLRRELASGAYTWGNQDNSATRRYEDFRDFFSDPANNDLRTFVKNSLFMFQDQFGANVPEAIMHDFQSAVSWVYAAWEEVKEAGAIHYETFAGIRVKRPDLSRDSLNE